MRELLGYDRLDNPAMLKELNALYRDWEQLNNFFKPSLKLKSKIRVKSQYKKKYDEPATPFERLKASNALNESKKAILENEYNSLDPFVLSNRIQRRLRKIEKMKKTGEVTAVGAPGGPNCSHPLTSPDLAGNH